MADPNEIILDPHAYIEVLNAELSRESQSRRFYQTLALQYQKQLDEKTGGKDGDE